MKEKRSLKLLAAGGLLLCGFILLGFSILWESSCCMEGDIDLTDSRMYKFVLCIFLGIFCFLIAVYYMSRERLAWLYRENKRFTEIIKASDHLVFCLSVKDRRFCWYGDLGKIMGGKKRDINLEKISHPDDFPIILQQLEDTGRGIVYYTETRFRGESGGYEIFLCRMVPVEQNGKKNGNIVGFLRKADP